MNDESDSSPDAVIIHRVKFKHPNMHFLYIGNLRAANDQKTLGEFHIQSVLSLGKNAAEKYPSVQGGYSQFDFSSRSDLSPHLPNIYRFLVTALERGNVLVHCFSGGARTAAVAIYFLMKSLAMSMKQARRCVEESAGHPVELSDYFERQLRQAESILFKLRK